MIFNENFAMESNMGRIQGRYFEWLMLKTHPTLGFPSRNTAVSYFAGNLPGRFCESGFPAPSGCP